MKVNQGAEHRIDVAMLGDVSVEADHRAGQFHVAFSGMVIGAGIIAGGPYNCTDGQLMLALNHCMETTFGAPDPARLFEQAESMADRDQIDGLAGLAGDRIYVFSGSEDETVTPAVVEQVPAFYRLAGVSEDAIAFLDNLPAGHAIVTEDPGNPCSATGSPFINDCDYGQVGALLGHLYGPLNPPSAEPTGTLVEFDQGEFLYDPNAHGMAETGFAYVPAECATGAEYRIHVAFQGIGVC